MCIKSDMSSLNRGGGDDPEHALQHVAPRCTKLQHTCLDCGGWGDSEDAAASPTIYTSPYCSTFTCHTFECCVNVFVCAGGGNTLE